MHSIIDRYKDFWRLIHHFFIDTQLPIQLHPEKKILDTDLPKLNLFFAVKEIFIVSFKNWREPSFLKPNTQKKLLGTSQKHPAHVFC